MGTVVQTEAEIDRLMAGTYEDVGLLLDTGHLVFAGGDPVCPGEASRHRASSTSTARTCARAALDDAFARIGAFSASVLDGIFTVPGDGAIDFTSRAATTSHADYAGWLVVEAEQDPAKAHPLTYARIGLRNLKRAAEDAGSDVASTTKTPVRFAGSAA